MKTAVYIITKSVLATKAILKAKRLAEKEALNHEL